MVAAVLWVANQPLADRIDNPIEQFQRYLTNQYRAIVRNLHDVADTVASLDRELGRPIHCHGGGPAGRPDVASSELDQP